MRLGPILGFLATFSVASATCGPGVAGEKIQWSGWCLPPAAGDTLREIIEDRPFLEQIPTGWTLDSAGIERDRMFVVFRQVDSTTCRIVFFHPSLRPTEAAGQPFGWNVETPGETKSSAKVTALWQPVALLVARRFGPEPWFPCSSATTSTTATTTPSSRENLEDASHQPFSFPKWLSITLGAMGWLLLLIAAFLGLFCDPWWRVTEHTASTLTPSSRPDTVLKDN